MITYIAICDDNEIEAILLEEIINNYISQNRLMAKVCIFKSAEELLNSPINFNIYILDIILPESNGFILAEQIRENNKSAKMIFTTADACYAVEAFRKDAFYFLIKPVDSIEVFKVFDKIREKIRQESFIIKTPGGDRRVPVDKLLYINIEGRCLCYHLTDGTLLDGYSLRSSFKKTIEHLLPVENFLFLTPALLINYRQIEVLKKDSIQFIGGEILYYPKVHYEKILEMWKK